jgi:hypothetical protein
MLGAKDLLIYGQEPGVLVAGPAGSARLPGPAGEEVP